MLTWVSKAASVIAVLVMLSAHTLAQPVPSAVHITGVVTDAQTGAAIRRARVERPQVQVGPTSPTSLRSSPVFTDEDGRFTLDLRGDATLTVTKAGYALETLKVAAPPRPEAVDVRVVMKRGAAITGRVVDALGAPILAATVAARRVTSSQTPAAPERPLTTLTDDLGEFRFGGLAEGEFQIGALRNDLDGRVPLGADSTETLVAATSASAPMRVRPGDSVDVGAIVVAADPRFVSGGTVGVSGEAVVTGQVRDSRGRPMKVVVHLMCIGASQRTTTSDAQGRFRFDHLAACSYLADVARPGLPSVQYGQRVSGQSGTPIDVRDGATVSGIDFVLSGGTAITGTISDEYGEPMQGVTIRALQIRRAGDRLAALSINPPRMSDDRGVYRLFGLLPGRYLVVADAGYLALSDAAASVAPTSDGNRAYVSNYYPGVSSVASALPVRLEQGDATGVDIALRPEPTTRVSGIVLDSAGRPVRGVLLGPRQRSSSIMLEPKLAAAAPDGTFAFDDVPPGEYVLQAIAPVGGPPQNLKPGPVPQMDMEFGMQYVTVGESAPPAVLLRTSPGATLHGRITVDGDSSALPPSFYVWPFPTDFDSSFMIGSGPAGLKRKDDGFFDVTGVTGSRRFYMASPVEGWYLKEVRVRGVDALDTPFDFGLKATEFNDIDVVVSPRAATISGTVTTAGGATIADYAVLVFATDESKWYPRSQSLRLERPSQAGEFRIGGLPPGSYYVLAMSSGSDVVTSGDWGEPMTLERLRSLATRVTVSEGETRAVTLRLVPDR